MKSCFTNMLLLSAGLLGNSCQQATATPDELSHYVGDPSHGLQQHQQIGEIAVAVTYQPADLLVAREVQAIGSTPHSVDSLRYQYSKAAYFLLAISRNGRDVLQPTEGFSRYSELLQTLAFHMDKQVCLVTSQGDTLRPINYYLDRTAAGTSASQLLLAFPKLPVGGTWQLRLRECGLGVGDLSFLFDSRQVQAIPTLVLP